jgi:hypothetical protein
MSHYLTSPMPNSVLFIFLLALHGSGSWSQACHLVGPGSILGTICDGQSGTQTGVSVSIVIQLSSVSNTPPVLHTHVPFIYH